MLVGITNSDQMTMKLISI